MAPIPKISYFPIIALGEPLKFILSYNHMGFEDCPVTYDDWPEVKPTTPFGKVPVLEVEGKQLHQSVALTRYYGRTAGLGGNDEWEDLQIDMAVDTVTDLRLAIASWHYDKHEGSKEKKQKPLMNEIIPFYIKRLDTLIGENGGYLANGKLSWGDIYFVSIMDYLNQIGQMQMEEKSPNIKALREKIINIPQIKQYLESRELGAPSST